MASLKVNGVLISKNAKTGYSINVDSCEPTPWCARHCYRRWRTQEIIEEMGWDDATPNTGPITWKTQRDSYSRNEARIIELASKPGMLEDTAKGIAARLRKRGTTHLRGNGTGDLFPELTMLYCLLAREGIKVFLFSRKPAEIAAIADICDKMRLAPAARPYVIASTDPTTTIYALGELVEATRYTNGHPALAYATAAGGPAGCAEVDRHPAIEHLVVIFGYHSNQTKTKLDHCLECPATAGEDIRCNKCRRCYGPEA